MKKHDILFYIILALIIGGIVGFGFYFRGEKEKKNNTFKKQTVQKEKNNVYSIKIYSCYYSNGNEILTTECSDTKRNEYKIKVKNKEITPLISDRSYFLFMDGETGKLFYNNEIFEVKIDLDKISKLSEYKEFKFITNYEGDSLQLLGILAVGNSNSSGCIISYDKKIYYDIINNELKYENKYDDITLLNNEVLAAYEYNIDGTEFFNVDLITINNNDILLSESDSGRILASYDNEKKMYIISYGVSCPGTGYRNGEKSYYKKNGEKLAYRIKNLTEIDKYYYYEKNGIIYKTDYDYNIISSTNKYYKVMYIIDNIPYALILNESNQLLLLNIEMQTTYKIMDNWLDKYSIEHYSTRYFGDDIKCENSIISGRQGYYVFNKNTDIECKKGIYIGMYWFGKEYYAYRFDIDTNEIIKLNNISGISTVQGLPW